MLAPRSASPRNFIEIVGAGSKPDSLLEAESAGGPLELLVEDCNYQISGDRNPHSRYVNYPSLFNDPQFLTRYFVKVSSSLRMTGAAQRAAAASL